MFTLILGKPPWEKSKDLGKCRIYLTSEMELWRLRSSAVQAKLAS